MICDKCKRNVATYHSKTSINGYVSEEHLCVSCAKGISFNPFSVFARDFFRDDFDLIGLNGMSKCSCNTTFDSIINFGRAGCPDCYSNYRGLLKDAVKSINSGAKHLGKKPEKEINVVEKEIDILREKLNKAVEIEDYETASELKKQIDNLRAGHNDK